MRHYLEDLCYTLLSVTSQKRHGTYKFVALRTKTKGNLKYFQLIMDVLYKSFSILHVFV